MLRRVGRRDRLVAAGCFAVVALALGSVVAVSDTPDPGNDVEAAVELVKLVYRGERVNRVVDYEFTRTKADGTSLTSPTIEAVNGDLFAVRSGSSLELAYPTIVYRCELVDDVRSSCLTSQRRETRPVWEVLTYAIGQGAYDVRRASDQTLAGEPARCFRLRARAVEHELPGLGEGGLFCLASDGVPLRIRVGRVGAVDERVARRVDRKINEDTTKRVWDGFEPAAAQPSG